MQFRTPVCQMLHSCAHTAVAELIVSAVGQLSWEKYVSFSHGMGWNDSEGNSCQWEELHSTVKKWTFWQCLCGGYLWHWEWGRSPLATPRLWYFPWNLCVVKFMWDLLRFDLVRCRYRWTKLTVIFKDSWIHLDIAKPLKSSDYWTVFSLHGPLYFLVLYLQAVWLSYHHNPSTFSFLMIPIIVLLLYGIF